MKKKKEAPPPMDEKLLKEIKNEENGRKKTDDGFAIYTADELKIGLKGSGNTDKCPFDCDCCF